jgi:DNA-binding XRE family transcriptional regulator
MQNMDFSNVRVSDVKIEIGTLIKKMRANRKLTQEELAKRLNLSRITIQNIERGNNFTIDTCLLVFQHFDEIESFNAYIKSKIEDYNEIKSIY